MKFSSSALLCALLPMAAAFIPGEKTVKILNTVYNCSSIGVEFTSTYGGLDSFKLSPRANATSFDWWYFDAVSSTSANESVTVVFYNAGPSAIGNPADGALLVELSGSFKNGTLFDFTIPATGTAVITEGAAGIAADWTGTGISFEGSSLYLPGTVYTVTVNNPELRIHGTVELISLAPPHYSCDLDKPGVSEVIVPFIGWSNAQPDARATVRLSIGNSEVSFEGVGYHDKNWGTVPLQEAVQSWYWGHAHLGPYSIVWFDTRGVDGTEYHSGFVAKDGVVLSAGCGVTSSVVRPWGTNSDYPPVYTTGTPEGFGLTFDLGPHGAFIANFSTQLVALEEGFYERYIGDISGGIEGGEVFQGRSLCEEFKFPLGL